MKSIPVDQLINLVIEKEVAGRALSATLKKMSEAAAKYSESGAPHDKAMLVQAYNEFLTVNATSNTAGINLVDMLYAASRDRGDEIAAKLAVANRAASN